MERQRIICKEIVQYPRRERSYHPQIYELPQQVRSCPIQQPSCPIPCDQGLFVANLVTQQTIPTTAIDDTNNLIPNGAQFANYPGVTLITGWEVESNPSGIISYSSGIFTANKVGDYVVTAYTQLNRTSDSGTFHTSLMQLYKIFANTNTLLRLVVENLTTPENVIQVHQTPTIVTLAVGDSLFWTLTNDGANAGTLFYGRVAIKLV